MPSVTALVCWPTSSSSFLVYPLNPVCSPSPALTPALSAQALSEELEGYNYLIRIYQKHIIPVTKSALSIETCSY